MVNTESRKKNSIRNIVFSMLAYFIQSVLSFVVRRYFIYYLGTDYLGLNSLFTNILSILSFAELGFGAVIVFAMYKPMAENDVEKVRQLLKFYKKCYAVIGCVVLIVGLAIIPFMGYFKTKAPDVQENIVIVYLIFLFNSALTYFFSHRRALLYASQRNDIESKVNILINVLLPVCQFLVLFLFRSYYLYIGLIGIMGLLNNLIVVAITQKKYLEYVEPPKTNLPKEDVNHIKKDIFAMFFHRLGSAVVTATDSLLIYVLLGATLLGKYSNYLMITSAVSAILGFFLNSLRGSVGNHIALKSREKNIDIFKKLNFLYMWLVSFCTIAIFCLSDPFIDVVLTKGAGGSLLFDKYIILLVSLNFYFNQSRFIVQIFKDCSGLFYQDRFRPLAEALLNLVSSIVLGKFIGLAGIIIGTILSNVLINLWVEPYVLNKYYFKESTKKYLLKYLLNFVVMVGIGLITYYTIGLLKSNSLGVLLIKFVICAVLPNILYMLIYFRTSDFKYYVDLIKNFITNIKKKHKAQDDKKVNVVGQTIFEQPCDLAEQVIENNCNVIENEAFLENLEESENQNNESNGSGTDNNIVENDEKSVNKDENTDK